jgi:hypothetical protein
MRECLFQVDDFLLFLKRQQGLAKMTVSIYSTTIIGYLVAITTRQRRVWQTSPTTQYLLLNNHRLPGGNYKMAEEGFGKTSPVRLVWFEDVLSFASTSLAAESKQGLLARSRKFFRQ